MKPGSSDRCKSKSPDGRLRCHLRRDHVSAHLAPQGHKTTHWYTTPPDVGLVLPAVTS